MYNGTYQAIYNAYCNNTMNGFQIGLPQTANTNQAQINASGQMCQYYNILSKKKGRINSQIIQQFQQQLTEEQIELRDIQNIKIQKQLNQLNQTQQYPFLVQQASNLQMLILRDLYSNFFTDILRDYKFYQQVMVDIDLQYPVSNKIKKSVNNNKDWFEQNYLSILKCQLIKNNQIKQTITEFRNTNIPKKAKKIIDQQKKERKQYVVMNRDLKLTSNKQEKQSQYSPRILFPSASPINRALNKDIRFKSTSRHQMNSTSKQVTHTEGSWRGVRDDMLDKTQQIFSKRVQYNNKDIKENQSRGGGVGQQRCDSVFRRLVTYDENLANVTNNLFDRSQGSQNNKQLENDQQQKQNQESIVFMAGGIKIRMNQFTNNLRNERSQSFVKDLSQKISDKQINRLNLTGFKSNLQLVNQRRQLAEQLNSISPKHNYQVYMDVSNSICDDIITGGSFQQNQYQISNIDIDNKRINRKNENGHDQNIGYDERNQITNLINEEKKLNNKTNTTNLQTSSVLGINRSKNLVSNVSAVGQLNQVLKQQNMQLLKMENLHTSPQIRSKKSSLNYGHINNSQCTNEQNQAKHSVNTNLNSTQLPAMKTPQSCKAQDSQNIKENQFQRKKDANQTGVVIIQPSQQQQQQNNQALTPLPTYHSCQLPTTPSNKQKESILKINDIRNQSQPLQLTPIQTKIYQKSENEEENLKSQTKVKDRGTLKELICSHYITPKNVNKNPYQIPQNQKLESLRAQNQQPYLIKFDPENYPHSASPPLNDLDEKSPKIFSSHISSSAIKYDNQRYQIGDEQNNEKKRKQLLQQQQLQNKITSDDVDADNIAMSKLLAEKDSYLINSTFNHSFQKNLQSQAQQEGRPISLSHAQNTIWFSNQNSLPYNENNQQNSVINYIQNLNSITQNQNKNSINQNSQNQNKQSISQNQNLNSTFDDKYTVACSSKRNCNNSIEQDQTSFIGDEKRQLISSTEGFINTINTEDNNKSKKEILTFIADNSVNIKQLEEQFKSSPSTPFRGSNNPRQRIYQNQRQIYQDIQKNNPILSNIQTQNNNKNLKYDNEISQSASNENDIQNYKATIPRGKKEKKNISQNAIKLSSQEKSEERQFQKKSNPYLQKNDFFKNFKRKQDNSKYSVGQDLNLSAYSNFASISQSSQSRNLSSASSAQFLKLKPLQNQSENIPNTIHNQTTDALNENYIKSEIIRSPKKPKENSKEMRNQKNKVVKIELSDQYNCQDRSKYVQLEQVDVYDNDNQNNIIQL